MTFVRAQQNSTYLMVFAALAAVLAPGQLAIAPLAAGGALLSWFWQPSTKRATWWLTAGVFCYFLYCFVAVFAGAAPLLTGASFLTILSVAKLFQRRHARDYLQICALSFLLMVAGTVLNAELGYGILFLIYVIATTWALILLHLRREIEQRASTLPDDHDSPALQRSLRSRTIVNRRFFAATALISITVFAFSSLLFVLIPRVGFGAFFSKARAGVAMAGFSDGVRLGGHGVIKKDSTIVMRVKIDDEYHGRRAPYIHWRGVAFDDYRRGEWLRSPAAPATNRRVTMSNNQTSHHVLYDGHPQTVKRLLAESREAVRQEIYLEPLGYDVLFGASMPLTFTFENRWRSKARASQNDEIRYPHSAGIKYTVVSTLTSPDPEVIERAAGRIPKSYAPYLNLPDTIPDRVIDMARDVTKDADSPYQKALALETYLRTKLQYTLEMEEPPAGQDPVDFFLFDRQQGHCEYFSSAMALMARAAGLPSRNVNGFLGGEWNEYDNYIAVRSGDAHSWVEIYIGGYGWVTFDPTPSAELDRLGRGGDGWWEHLARMLDTLKFKWFQWVIEYDLRRQLQVFRKIGSFFKSDRKSEQQSKRESGNRWKGDIKGLIAPLTSGLAVAGAIFYWRRRRRRPTSHAGRRRTAISRTYLVVLRALARRGFARRPSQTPLEFSRAMSDARMPGAAMLRELTNLYYQSEFRADPPDAETNRKASQLKSAILSAVNRRRR